MVFKLFFAASYEALFRRLLVLDSHLRAVETVSLYFHLLTHILFIYLLQLIIKGMFIYHHVRN